MSRHPPNARSTSAHLAPDPGNTDKSTSRASEPITSRPENVRPRPSHNRRVETAPLNTSTLITDEPTSHIPTKQLPHDAAISIDSPAEPHPRSTPSRPRSIQTDGHRPATCGPVAPCRSARGVRRGTQRVGADGSAVEIVRGPAIRQVAVREVITPHAAHRGAPPAPPVGAAREPRCGVASNNQLAVFLSG